MLPYSVLQELVNDTDSKQGKKNPKENIRNYKPEKTDVFAS